MRATKLSWIPRGLAAMVALASAPILAEAQPTTGDKGDLALSRFNAAPAGDRMFSVQSPFIAGDPAVHTMLLVDYARDPLVLKRESAGDKVGAVVSDQLFLNASLTFALWGRAMINVDMPFALLQRGDSPLAFGDAFTSPSAAVGDLRLDLRVRLFGEHDDIFQLAVSGYAWVPTGSSGSYVSDGGMRGMPQLIVGGRRDRIVWSFAGGPDLRRPQRFARVEQGTMLTLGAGVGFLLDDERDMQIGSEATVSMVLSDINRHTTNAEVLLGARYRFLSVMEVGVGVGPGLTSGIGTPSLRAVAMLAFTPEQDKEEPPPGDRDEDTILDPEDACPDLKGIASEDSKKNGCPEAPTPLLDKDGDGIGDAKDACPDVKGVASEDPKKHGCPPDKDEDGIVDANDGCPDVKGVANEDPKKHGCPPDMDGDGVPDQEDGCVDIPGFKTAYPATNGCPVDSDGDTIRDDKDACPLERGKPDKDPKKNGCPQSVRVSEGEIIILQQVQFDTNRATIKKVSNPLLDEVAGVLKEHPEILKIEVQGHTDNRGNAKRNDKLSQDRATSVMNAMIKRGIEAGRLSAKGYGQSAPIADNKTPQGRQQNRRVQFKIVEKKPKPLPSRG